MRALEFMSVAVGIGLVLTQAGCIDSILTCQPDSSDPIQGRWTEQSSIACDDGALTTGQIQEIIFCQGRFSVTWEPFESFQDYWGTYNFNSNTNTLTMTVDGGNFIPDDTDLTGTVEFPENATIILRDIFLGTRDLDANTNGIATTICGHVLE